MSKEFLSTSPPASVATSAAEKNFFLPCGLLGGSESDLNGRKDADRGSDFTLSSLGSTFSQFKAVPHSTFFKSGAELTCLIRCLILSRLLTPLVVLFFCFFFSNSSRKCSCYVRVVKACFSYDTNITYI